MKKTSIERLIELTQDGFWAKARRINSWAYEPEDLVQAALMAVHRVWQRDGDLPEENLVRLAGRAGSNAMIDLLRRQNPLPGSELPVPADHPIAEVYQDDVDVRDLVQHLYRVMPSKTHRRVLWLRVEGELTGAKIAQIVGMSPASVSRIFSEIRECATEADLVG